MFGLPLWALTTFKFIKVIFDKITLKQWLLLAGIILVLFAQWKFYSWAFDRGVSHQTKVDGGAIAALNQDLRSAKTELTNYKKSFEQWKKDNQVANDDLKRRNEELNQRLVDQIHLNERLSKQKQKVLIHEIPTFIPSNVDFNLPTGFVQLYNFSIETPAASEESSVSFRPEGDASAPSGIKLSEASETIVINNSQCLGYRNDVLRWQAWYRETKDAFEKANRLKSDSLDQIQRTDTSTLVR